MVSYNRFSEFLFYCIREGFVSFLFLGGNRGVTGFFLDVSGMLGKDLR